MKKINPLFLLLGLFLTSNLVAQNVEFENIQIINEERLDFSPVPYGNGLMYTSSKGDRFLQCPPMDDQQYTDLYFAPKNVDGSFDEPVRLKGEVNGKYNDGVPIFTADGNTMYFTRNNLKGKNAQGIIDLKIYMVELVDGNWKNLNAFPHNSDDWSTAHPALSPDGKVMVFSSNRDGSQYKAGSNSEESMDLWVSRLDDSGVWEIPRNLGPSVNTTGNELFPYFDSEGYLFFSSNGHGGEGGLDIFAAINDDMENNDEWEMVGNIGTPFNTPNDEVAFVPIASATEGYMASSHSFDNAEGMDDIYRWTRESDMMDALIQVVDKGTGKPLENANVAINPTAFKNPSYQKYGPVLDMLYGGDGGEFVLEPMKLQTDAEGMLPPMRVFPESAFVIDADKNGYIPENRTPTTEDLVENEVYVIPLERKFATLTVIVVEDPTNDPIPIPNITVRNKRTGEIVEITGDGEGTGTTQIDCNDDYEISASKDPYYPNQVELTDYEVDCSDGEVTVIVPLKKPMIVILEPIFYNFDRYYIRKRDAAPTLDSLIVIMNKYPSLVVQMDAHTDARGTSRYNEILSANRSNAAKKYLVKRGISSDRVLTKDFGESDPYNDCTDDVYCPESDHQLNRRVDVRAVSHKESRVVFETRDISTMTIISDRKDKEPPSR